MKIVGNRRTTPDAHLLTPEESFRRAVILQAQAELLNPHPRPRSVVFKAKPREDYERWRREQTNPRLW